MKKIVMSGSKDVKSLDKAGILNRSVIETTKSNMLKNLYSKSKIIMSCYVMPN